MEQLICHLIGDFWLQNDWMATNKKKDFKIALLHSLVYTLPFLFLTQNIISLLTICLTHAVIDGSNIVNKLNQLKNWNFEYKSGYNEDTNPVWLWSWLLIIQDNTIHLLINFLTLKYIG